MRFPEQFSEKVGILIRKMSMSFKPLECLLRERGIMSEQEHNSVFLGELLLKSEIF